MVKFHREGVRLNRKAFCVMCGQFATILASGVPVLRAVELIAGRTADRNLRHMLTAVGRDLRNGQSLSAAFAARGGTLPSTFIETLRAGEESGTLARSFATLHRYFEKRIRMESKIREAALYPLFVLCVAAAVAGILLGKVIPAFLDVFDTFSVEPPRSMKLLAALAAFFQRYGLLLAAVPPAVFAAYRLALRSASGRLYLARLELMTPVLGTVAELNAASQFAGTLSLLLDAGLTLPRAVAVTAAAVDNRWIGAAAGRLPGRLEEGRTLASSMREAACLPEILTDMTAVGEETGELKSALASAARYYDGELETAVRRALACLGPVLLCVTACVAGFLVVTVYLSLSAMYTVI